MTASERHAELAVTLLGPAIRDAALQVDYRILMAFLAERLGALAQAAIVNKVMTVDGLDPYLAAIIERAQEPLDKKPALMYTDGNVKGRRN